MVVYILRNGFNGHFIDAYDTEESAIAQKNNLIKTGEFRKVDLEAITVKSDTVIDLQAVKIEGYFTQNGPKFSVSTYNIPNGVTNVDKLTFNVTSRLVSFVGFAKLTAAEIQANDITSLKARLTAWIENSFSERLLNDNPEEVDPQPDPEEEPEPENPEENEEEGHAKVGRIPAVIFSDVVLGYAVDHHHKGLHVGCNASGGLFQNVVLTIPARRGKEYHKQQDGTDHKRQYVLGN